MNWWRPLPFGPLLAGQFDGFFLHLFSPVIILAAEPVLLLLLLSHLAGSRGQIVCHHFYIGERYWQKCARQDSFKLKINLSEDDSIGKWWEKERE